LEYNVTHGLQVIAQDAAVPFYLLIDLRIDGPDGDHPSLRPKQLIAVSLDYSPLTAAQRCVVAEACSRHLQTSHGLRSLAPGDPNFIGRYGGNRRQRGAAYHQGTVWGWPIGFFFSAHLRTYGDPEQVRSFLQPLLQHLPGHGLGSLSEIFGDPPFTPHGRIAQAWNLVEMLLGSQAIQEMKRKEGKEWESRWQTARDVRDRQ
jgi:glycogen debranching enzyme